MKTTSLLILGLALMFGTGCGRATYETNAQDTKLLVPDPSQSGDAGDPAQKTCAIETADYALDISVLSFEMTDAIKGSIGYDFAKGFLGAIGIGANIKGGRLDTVMELKHPINLSDKYASSTQSTKFSQNEFSFTLDAGKLSAGGDFFYQTPIAKLSQQALTKNLKDLLKQAKNAMDPWETRVTRLLDDSRLVIAAGTSAGLQLGDQLDLYNAADYWEGDPCGSRYISHEPLNPDRPTARYKVTSRTPETAILALVDGNYEVKVGAVAHLAPIKNQKNRKLSKAIKINRMSSHKIVIEGRGEVDLLDYMVEQIDPILRGQGYYLRTLR
jgi:hypothetical protein